MRAVSRFGVLLSAGTALALALAPTVTLAQEVPATTNTPAADAIGPQGLQNFSLHGTVTRPAEEPPAAPAVSQKSQAKAPAQVARPSLEPSSSLADRKTPQSTTAAPASAPSRTQVAAAQPARADRQPERNAASAPQSAPTSTPTTLPALSAATVPSTEAASSPAGTFAPAPTTPGTLAPEHGFSFLPWLLATLAVAIGGAFLFWRNHGRHAFAAAGGPQAQAFVAPETPPSSPRRLPPEDAAPQPAPTQAPQPKPWSGVPAGIVSTRLRPWVEVGFHPLRCVLEKERLTVEFEMELFNSGSAPARAVLVEATLFNAGPSQDQEIGNFFANPVGEGERIAAIPPLKRMSFKTQIVIPIEQVRAYELGGRQVFVPLIAFNTLYDWGSGAGQTSAAFLLGRDTSGEKMAPFRLDLGPRIFRGLGSRLLPAAVRS